MTSNRLSLKRPGTNDFAPFYQSYVNAVPEGDLLEILHDQLEEMLRLLSDLSDEAARFRYAENKWSIKEIVGHLNDAERLFVYRAMCFARNDPGPLPAMDENQYVQNGHFDRRSLAELLEEHRFLRLASLAFFKGLDDEALSRRGAANKCEFTVNAFAWIIAGHERRHLEVLKQRYLARLRNIDR